MIRGILDCFTAHGARVKGGTRLIVVVVVVIVIVTEQEQWSSIDGACPVVAVGVCSAHGRVGSLGVWGKMFFRGVLAIILRGRVRLRCEWERSC